MQQSPTGAPPDPVFDRRDQLQQIQSGLMQGEHLYAVYDCKGVGTGFLAMTDRRVILQDRSFVGQRTAITSIGYGRIQAVSVVSDKSLMGHFFSSGTIGITVPGHEYEATFRSTEKAHHAHDLILWHMLQRGA